MSDDGRDIETGRFSKGNQFRKQTPKKQLNKSNEQAIFNEILAECKGDSVCIMRKTLERGSELNLSRSEAMRLCDKLAPYQKPKLASTEIKEEKTTQFIIQQPDFKQIANKIIDLEVTKDQND